MGAILTRKPTLKEELKKIWTQFLAECVYHFIPDGLVRMRFTRQLGFHSKVKELSKQSFTREFKKSNLA